MQPIQYGFHIESSWPFTSSNKEELTHGVILKLESKSHEITFEFDSNTRVLWGQHMSLDPSQTMIFGSFGTSIVIYGGTSGLLPPELPIKHVQEQ